MSFFSSIFSFFKKLWDKLKKILTILLIVLAVVLVIWAALATGGSVLFTIFTFEVTTAAAFTIAAVAIGAAFLLDPETAMSAIDKVGDIAGHVVGAVAEAAAGAAGAGIGGLLGGLAKTPLGIGLIIGGIYFLTKSDGPGVDDDGNLITMDESEFIDADFETYEEVDYLEDNSNQLEAVSYV